MKEKTIDIGIIQIYSILVYYIALRYIYVVTECAIYDGELHRILIYICYCYVVL